MCPQCPVRADSLCAQEKIGNLKNEIESLGGAEALEPQRVPGVYCSTDNSTCGDLNFNGQCICNTCPVLEEYNLKNAKIIHVLLQQRRRLKT